MLAELLTLGLIAGIYAVAFGVLALPKHWYRAAQWVFVGASVLADAKIVHWSLTSTHGFKLRLGLAVLGMLTTTLAAVWFIRKVQADIKGEHAATTAGAGSVLEELRFALGDNDRIVRITVNGAHIWTSLSFLDGTTFNGRSIKGYPVRVYTQSNDPKPYVDTKVYSSECGLVEIKANHLTAVPKGWDWNANDRAIEIINESRVPVFQVVLSAANQLDIWGVFSEAESKSGLQSTRLFKYPSAQYQGELIEPRRLLPLTAKSLYQLYLDSCGRVGGSHGGHHIKLNDVDVLVEYKFCADLDSKAAWINIFIPKYVDVLAILKALAEQYEKLLEGELRSGNSYLRLHPGELPERGTKLVFTGVVGIYHEDILLPEQPDEIRAVFEKRGVHARLYGPDYVVTRNSPLSKA